MKKIKAYVINHGHMDLEWCLPMALFRPWFQQAITELDRIVKTEEEYKCYVFDGVVYPVLYAIENHRQLEKITRDLVKSEKLKIGPFYTQFDEFLPCGESIIKNCLWGDRYVRSLGGKPMKAGYFLDNFGHPVQLPQILQNFDIKSLFFSRGMTDIGQPVREFAFESPDGSKIAAININYSTAFSIYANNQPRCKLPNYIPYFNEELWSFEYLLEVAKHKDHKGLAEQIVNGVKKNATFYPSGVVAVFAGCDHCPPQSGISETLKLANEMQDEIEFIFADAEELSNAIYAKKEELPVFSEDLIGSKFDLLLFSALSTRIYLKQMEYNCEKLLFDYALPLEAYCKLIAKDTEKSYLDDAIKSLLINSTHDSIHGSGVDAIHREDEYRFDQAAQISACSIHDSLNKLASYISNGVGNDEILVYAPHDYEGFVSAWIYTYDKEVVVKDNQGKICESVLMPLEEIPKNANGLPYYLPREGVSIRNVVFKAKLNEGEIKKYSYSIAEQPTKEISAASGNVIGNEYFELICNDNEITLLDKKTGNRQSGFISLFEEPDTGDEFDYSSPWKEYKTYSSDGFGYTDTKVETSSVYQKLTTKCMMRVPLQMIDDDRSDELAYMPVTLEFSLWKNVKRLDIKIKIENYSKNHRVRAIFNCPCSFDSVRANQTFCVEDFSIVRPTKKENWAEEATKELPFREWVSVQDEKATYVISAKGLYLFEMLNNRQIAFTLFRSVGEVMRINLKNREGCCANGYLTPEAQCIREMNFEFSIFSMENTASNFEIMKETQSFICPPMPHSLRHKVKTQAKADALSLYTIENNENVVVSLFDKSFDGEYYLLRFYEINGEDTSVTIDVPLFKEAYLANMNEEILETLAIVDGKVTMNVGKNKIITLLFK